MAADTRTHCSCPFLYVSPCQLDVSEQALTEWALERTEPSSADIKMSAPEVSHGRGGAGNITPDDTTYVDGEIVRTGDEGTAVSTGRGGA